ncbi:hypothetical protein GYMLUDRAFT_58542 [Collybiopsis luxurians FD-317 M1]|uniref:DUF6533 domain-containing protein n=1 Tax=Collybiopsis luxurians FD-317 M1 TaxID=944289 RepID=A0A0D0CRP7_9AGAR|nr:hypothetical protein GYMLUDRAFT_58542 [Collybiopsis luxurians FD-317 M1]
MNSRVAEDITLASLALLYYDYVLTFNEEVAFMWKMKFSTSTLLYILCRYAMLANLLYFLAHVDKLGLRASASILRHLVQDQCSARGAWSGSSHWYDDLRKYSFLCSIVFPVTFTMRTYVVWAQSRIVLASLVAIGLTTVVTDAVFIPHQSCENSWGAAAAVDLVRSLLTIVFETLSAVLIFIRSLQAFRSSGTFLVMNSITSFLMQEGAIYFWSPCIGLYNRDVCLEIVNRGKDLGSLSAYGEIDHSNHLACQSKYLHDLLNAFTLPLSGLLTARFLLHLRAWTKARSDAVSCSTAVDLDEELEGYHTSGRWSENGMHLASMESGYSEATSVGIFTADFGEDPVAAAKRTMSIPR